MGLTALTATSGAQQNVDLLIRGGTLVDGTGSAARRADVGIRGDRITFVGDAAPARVTGTRIIDATGLIVAPGFIDPHTHSAGELSSPQSKANLNYLMQGVTTVMNNNDGGGPIDIGRQLGEWAKNGIGTNTAVYIGQGSVRRAVMGSSGDAPTAAQLDSMKKLVTRGMDDGAIGMSTGLFYAPGSYSSTEEVIELAKVAAAKGGRYDSHIRDESSYSVGLVGAVLEVIRIGREARMPVHISHIKALGVDVWGQSDTVIALMKKARAEGIDITASQYPYTASGSSVGASLLPRWAEIGGGDSLRARFNDPATRQRLVTEMTDNLRRRGGANSLLITGGRDSTIRGKRLDAIARMWSTTPIEAGIRIILSGGASVASFNMDEKDIVNFMKQDFISMDSDGSGGHPRLYGAFPKFFHEYVRQKKVMPFVKAVQRSSSASAKMLGISERGTLVPNYFADVVVFDSATFADRATYEQPTLLAVGMKYVIVNGVVAIDNGKYTGATSGRVLKGAQVSEARSPTVPYPDGYRTLTHVKSTLIGPAHRNFAANGGFQHIYANVQAMEGYRSRVFPEGSVIAFEWLEMTENAGAFLEGPRRQVDVMVKDSARYAGTGGWGFQRFVKDSKTELAATPTPQQCYACHDNLKKDGLVLSTYRP